MKLAKKSIKYIIIMLLLVPCFFNSSVSAKEAETIQELKQQLESLKAEKKNNDTSKSQTQSQINNKKQAIYNAYQEQETIKTKVAEAEERIIESNQEIAKKKSESDKMFQLYQASKGENFYVEFIMSSSSVSDMMMRTAIVEQIIKNNEEITEGLKALIAENENLKLELANRNVELENQKVQYEKAVKSLGNKLSELNELNEDINDQISNQQILIKYYQSICKSETQKLSECTDLVSDTGFVRPVAKGRITSYWGYRTSPITGKANSFHNAIDISYSNFGKSPVYSTAAGMVAAITKKSSCGGNIVYIHHIVLGKKYTSQYAHLYTVNVKVGDKVTAATQIGTAGGNRTLTPWDKCTTGAHLHFGISTGHYLGAGSGSYSSWSKFIASSVNPLNYIGNSKSWTKRN